MSRYELRVAGPLPTSVAERIRARFGAVTVRAAPGGTVLEGSITDTAAVRALVELVWDTGGDLRLLRLDTEEATSDHAGNDETGNVETGNDDAPTSGR